MPRHTCGRPPSRASSKSCTLPWGNSSFAGRPRESGCCLAPCAPGPRCCLWGHNKMVFIDKLAQCSKLLYTRESVVLSKEIRALQEKRRRMERKIEWFREDSNGEKCSRSPFTTEEEQDAWFDNLCTELEDIYSAPHGVDTENNTSLYVFLATRKNGKKSTLQFSCFFVVFCDFCRIFDEL